VQYNFEPVFGRFQIEVSTGLSGCHIQDPIRTF